MNAPRISDRRRRPVADRLFDQLWLHRAVLRPPAAVRLPGEPQLSADLWNFLALTQLHLRFLQQQNNPLRTVSLPYQ